MSPDGRDPITAAVLEAPGRLALRTLRIDRPGPGEVRVRVRVVGVCHSDLHYVDGTHATDLPEVLGHEASGEVVAVGTGVTAFAPGDRVVTSLTMFCGRCPRCLTGHLELCENRASLRARPRPALVAEDGTPVGAMGGVGAFAEEVLVRETGLARLPDGVGFDVGALFGCAVLTGVGAVTRCARVEVGDTVLVIGCGGIGLAAIAGARLAGASRIVAVDVSPAKLDAARRFGATDALASGDIPRDVRALLGGGVDHAFEAVGRRELVEAGLAALRPGGTCVMLGMVPDATPIQVTPSDLYFHEKRLTGAFIGSSRFPVDIPRWAELYRQGRLPLDELITHRFPLSRLGEAFAALASGEALRAVVELGG